MHPLSKFGFLLLSGTSVGILLLKLLTRYNAFTNTTFYSGLVSLAILFGIFVGLALVMIVGSYIRSLIILLIIFIVSVIVVYLFIAPVYVGSVGGF